MLKKFRAGALAVFLVGVTAFAVLLSAAPAQAWDSTGSQGPPPRIAPPPATTIPKVATPLTKPVIPPGILGSALKFLGTAGVGYMIGSTYRAVSCSAGITPIGSFTPCSTAEGGSYDAANAGSLLAVDPVPDKVWCVYNGGCPDAGLAVPGTLTKPANTSSAQLVPTIAAPAAGAPEKVSVSTIAVTGTYCEGHPTWNECKGLPGQAYGYSLSTVKYAGECKLANGSNAGLWNGYSNASKLTTINGPTLSPTAQDFGACGPGQIVQWVKIIAAPVQTNVLIPSVAPAYWVNPGVETWRDTTITSNLTCKNGSGGSVTVSKTGPPGTGLAPVVSCPSGYLPDSGNTTIGTNFLDAPTKTEEWSITPAVREAYPDCIGWQSAGCKLMIELDGVECNPGVAACRDWEEVFKHQPSRVKCKWGPYDMDISHCMPLRNAYIGETGTVTDPKRDPLAAPIAVDPFGNPLQNNPDPYAPTAPDTGTDPGTSPGANPGPADIPQYGTDPVNPNPNPNAPPSTDPTLSDSNCWGTASVGFNPLEWVLQPVKCALSWAFVPKTSVDVRVNQIATDLAGVAPFSWVAGMPVAGPGGSGCPDWNLVLPGGAGTKNVVCDSSFTAAVVSVRYPLLGLLTAAMVWPLIRSLWYALIPIARVVPTGGK